MKEIYERPNGTRGVRTVNDEPTLTQQQFKDDCDVNCIMEKYLKTGTITHLRSGKTGVYADITDVPDYQGALDNVIRAQKSFSLLPHTLKQRFGNDPQQLINYLGNPENHDEAIKLGLMVAKPSKTDSQPASAQPGESSPPQK